MAPSSFSLSAFIMMMVISSWSLPFLYLAAADEALIEKACNATVYHDLCISTIKSDNSSSTADMKGLVGIVIGKAHGSAADTASFIAGHLKEDPSTYGQAGVLCENHYTSAMQSLDESLKDLEGNQFEDAGRKSSEAREAVKVCVSDFGRLGVTYPPEWEQREETFEKLCDIASAITSNLHG